MSLQCPKCGSYNTIERDSKMACFNCNSFYSLGKREINWRNLAWFIVIVVIALVVSFWFGVPDWFERHL